MAGKKITREERMLQRASAQLDPPITTYLDPIEEEQPETTKHSAPTAVTVPGEAASNSNVKTDPVPTPTPEDPSGKQKKRRKVTKGGKTLVSFYCDAADYEALEKLARRQAVLAGEKNGRGQGIGAGTIICDAVHEYVLNHANEIALWESSAEFFKSENLRKFMEDQLRLTQEQLKHEMGETE